MSTLMHALPLCLLPALLLAVAPPVYGAIVKRAEELLQQPLPEQPDDLEISRE